MHFAAVSNHLDWDGRASLWFCVSTVLFLHFLHLRVHQLTIVVHDDDAVEHQCLRTFLLFHVYCEAADLRGGSPSRRSFSESIFCLDFKFASVCDIVNDAPPLGTLRMDSYVSYTKCILMTDVNGGAK